MVITMKKYDFLEGKKIYISGKMTGFSKRKIIKDFGDVEKGILKNKGHPMNPAVLLYLKDTEGFSYTDFLDIDFKMLSKCDMICLLDTWCDSEGAKKELNYARAYGLDIIYYSKERGFTKD